MNEQSSASSTDKGAPNFAQRGGALSISTSKPRPFEAVNFTQSPTAKSALPQPSPHRTFSGPAAIPSSSTFIQEVLSDKSGSPVTPRSAGYQTRNLRFDKGNDELKMSKTTPEMRTSTSSRDGMKRRHTTDPRMNIHTECGRHGDDWLFGGWTDKVKKIWDKKEPRA